MKKWRKFYETMDDLFGTQEAMKVLD